MNNAHFIKFNYFCNVIDIVLSFSENIQMMNENTYFSINMYQLMIYLTFSIACNDGITAPKLCKYLDSLYANLYFTSSKKVSFLLHERIFLYIFITRHTYMCYEVFWLVFLIKMVISSICFLIILRLWSLMHYKMWENLLVP